MSNIYDIRSHMEESALMAQKQYRDEIERKEKIERENASLKLQSDATKELKDLKATFQQQIEIDRKERNAERKLHLEREAKAEILRKKERAKDRLLLWKASIIAAVIGAIVASVLTVIFERFFK